jgi:hypothetical protein
LAFALAEINGLLTGGQPVNKKSKPTKRKPVKPKAEPAIFITKYGFKILPDFWKQSVYFFVRKNS